MIITDLPNAYYHARLEVGSSLAKTALDSIQLYRDTLDGLVPQKKSAAMSFGTQFHMAMLEPDRYASCVVESGPINPNTGKQYGTDTKKYTDWADENPDKFVADPAIAIMCQRMPHEFAHLLIGEGKSEVSVFAPIFGLAAKCRPDRLVGTAIYDLKTIDCIDSIDHHIKSYRYWFSAAWYRAVMKAETGLDHTFQPIFAESKPPYRWAIVDLSSEYIDNGDYYVRYVAELIQKATASGNWADAAPIRRTATKPESLGSFDHDNE